MKGPTRPRSPHLFMLTKTTLSRKSGVQTTFSDHANNQANRSGGHLSLNLPRHIHGLRALPSTLHTLFAMKQHTALLCLTVQRRAHLSVWPLEHTKLGVLVRMLFETT